MIFGHMFEKKENNIISNVFTYKLINKTTKDIEVDSFKVRNLEAKVKLVSANDIFIVPKQGLSEGTLFIEIDKGKLKGDKTKLTIDVYSKAELIETTTVNFLGPHSYN